MKARWGYAATIAVMAVCTIAGTALLSLLSVTDVAMLYLVAVGLVASRSARGPSVFAAVLAVASFDFFFVPPRFTFTVDDLHYVFTFAMMLACALVISWLTERVREDARAERQREQGTAVLYPMSAELLAASSLAQVDALVRRVCGGCRHRAPRPPGQDRALAGRGRHSRGAVGLRHVADRGAGNAPFSRSSRDLPPARRQPRAPRRAGLAVRRSRSL
jgi:hypothetical protein